MLRGKEAGLETMDEARTQVVQLRVLHTCAQTLSSYSDGESLWILPLPVELRKVE